MHFTQPATLALALLITCTLSIPIIPPPQSPQSLESSLRSLVSSDIERRQAMWPTKAAWPTQDEKAANGKPMSGGNVAKAVLEQSIRRPMVHGGPREKASARPIV
ncbi:hypothetical protein EJ08DRAFT_677840 [Tothia fuscella]|uniref:Secreted protein n=1 Tax=Tothia fuscella TaxID=1048955 RepID=A0A9P4NUM6_9PEZI|nr:hypothetical protein EJ08DRAFT_677840 [Tothia fuscella]